MGETADFFNGKTLFVVGATGFLGKVLLERVLWQLPQVRRIVLLMRPHSAQNPEVAVRLRAERAIFSSSIFNRLRARHGERFEAFVRDKVKIVAGDLSCPDLGLDSHSLRVLGSEVDFIINLAAQVGFDERLDRAVSSNTVGPRHLLNLGKRFRNPTMLHVSTCYVSGRRAGSIPEQVLEPDVSAFDLMGITNNEPFRTESEIENAQRLAQSVESESRTPSARSEFRHAALVQSPSGRMSRDVWLDGAAEKNRQRWVRDALSREGLSRARRFGWIDTYTFTKAMGEQLLVKSSDGVPIIILRPSIIESSLYQPEPGWIEGYRMSSPILFSFGRGELPDFPGRQDSVIDIIPVDFVVSALLASLPMAPDGKNPKVFQVGSGSENPLRLDKLMEYTLEYFRQLPLQADSGPIVPRAWKYPSPDKFNAWVGRRQRMLRIVFALCDRLDFWPHAAWLSQKLAVKRIHLRRLEYLTRLYTDYVRLLCHFETDNTRGLFRSLQSQDQRDFFFDPTIIDWPKYIREIHLPGVRRHAIEEGRRSVGRYG
jgi:nucleoside-diphosphate-sugar epimerase